MFQDAIEMLPLLSISCIVSYTVMGFLGQQFLIFRTAESIVVMPIRLARDTAKVAFARRFARAYMPRLRTVRTNQFVLTVFVQVAISFMTPVTSGKEQKRLNSAHLVFYFEGFAIA